MKFLAITRAVVSFATSLHLSSLKLGISRMEARVTKAMRRTDLASVIRHKAEQVAAAAKADYVAIRKAEQGAKADLVGFVGAAKAEADKLRRGHTVGA